MNKDAQILKHLDDSDRFANMVIAKNAEIRAMLEKKSLRKVDSEFEKIKDGFTKSLFRKRQSRKTL